MSNRDSFDDFDDNNQDDGFMTFDARDEVEDRSRGPLVIAGIVAVLLLCGLILWRLYAGGRDAGETPQISADDGSFKTAPADPGGTVATDLDKGVFDAASGASAPPVQVQPNTVGAEDPLLADGTMAPATAPVVAATPAVTPRPTVPAPKPAPAPAPTPPTAVAQPKPKPAPQQVAAVTPPRPKPAAPAAPAPAPAPKSVKDTLPPAPAPVASPPKAAATPAPSAAPAAGSSRIAAQLGSFQTRAAADVALSRYRASGLSGPVSVVAADLGAKGTWYRIRATGFDTRAEVNDFCTKARSAGAQCIPTGG